MSAPKLQPLPRRPQSSSTLRTTTFRQKACVSHSSPSSDLLRVRDFHPPTPTSDAYAASAAYLFAAIRFRLWWFLPTACLAGAGEIVGWSARLWSSINYVNSNAFTAQYVLILQHVADIDLSRQNLLHDYCTYTVPRCMLHHLLCPFPEARSGIQSSQPPMV